MDNLWMQLQVNSSDPHKSEKKKLKRTIDAMNQLRNLIAV
jgi:hypothetical protein